MNRFENKLIIWDLDGTLYTPSPSMNFVPHYTLAMGKAAKELGMPITPEEGQQIASANYQYYGHAAIGFHAHGLDPYEVNRRCFDLIDPNLLEVERNLKLYNAFKNTPVGDHCILTHSSTYWARTTLRKIELLEFFKDNQVIGVEAIGFKLKNKNTDAVRCVMNSFGYTPENTFMVEDTARNLKPAKDAGIRTILLTYGKTVEIPEWVDEIYSTAEDFLQSEPPAPKKSEF